MTQDQLTAIIAEDSVLLRDGLVRLLERAHIDVLATCDNGDDLIKLVAEHNPGVVIADVRMPPTFTSEGIEAALTIREKSPHVPILVLSQYVEEKYAADLLSNPRGLGYLLKDRVADTADFVRALKAVAAGGTELEPEVVAQLLTKSRRDNPLAALTPREREVLELMAHGKMNAAIAEECYISASSVEKHIAAIFSKLGLAPEDGHHRRVMAVLMWLRHDGDDL